MINKDYYRLNEMESCFGLSMADLKYLVDEKQLRLVIKSEHTDFMLGEWREGKGFTSLGTVVYHGLISIEYDQQRQLLNNAKVLCKSFKLIDKNKIEKHRAYNDFGHKLPSWLTFISREVNLDDSDLVELPAILTPELAVDPKKAIKSALESLKKSTEVKRGEAFYTSPKKELLPRHLLLTLQEVCFLSHEIDELFSNTLPKQDESTQQVFNVNQLGSLGETPLPKSADQRNYQFTELLKRILTAQPALTAKSIWKIIQDEAAQSELDREFDIEGILVDATYQSIKWRSRYRIDQEIKVSTFDSAVSRVRKKYGISKNR